jgi:undecaprenyl-diphosphatase
MGERHALALPHALALGLLHGPTELLPISSSGHTTLVPWLAGWPYDELDPQLRKSFEVALHAGTAIALLAHPPWESRTHDPTSRSRPRRLGTELAFLLPAIAFPAFTGYTLGGAIERRLGTPGTIVTGLLAGSVAMVFAERHTLTRACHACPTYPVRDDSQPAGGNSRPTWSDGVALGIAQALALIPGVSRSGATIATARTRGFSRMEADRLSWRVGLPVIAGATSLKGARVVGEGIPRQLRLPLAAGAASAFFSTLASTRLLTPTRRARLPLACAVYRVGLALLVIRRMRDKPVRTPSILKDKNPTPSTGR